MHSHFRQCCSRLQERYPRESWLVSLGLSATTDHSDVSKWCGDAIIYSTSQFLQLYRCFGDRYNSMEDPQGTFSLFRSHHVYLIHAFSSCIMSKHSHLSDPSWSIQQWYSHPVTSSWLIPTLFERRKAAVMSLWISKRNCCCCQVLCFNYSKY